jgi:hypothetical protein
MTMPQRPPRVQSVLRGPTEAACLQQALTDGQRAAQNGYAPIAQSWGRDASGITLTILYELTQVPPLQPAAPWSAPTTASAWMQPQAYSQAPQPQDQVRQPMQPPPLTAAQPGVNRRVAGAITSIVVFVIAFLVYSALNRALY